MDAMLRSGRNYLSRTWALFLALPLLGLLCPAAAFAQVGSARYSSIVVNAATGDILEADNADAPRHPASLAKLMTLYLTFDALQAHRIALDTQVPVSPHCASMQPTKLGLLPGMPFTVQQGIYGIVTRSANDAACALGEMLGGGSEESFAAIMTQRARALGMEHTHFANASGLPAADEWTTARDLATLARDLIIRFPEDYHYFSTPSFVFRGVAIYNHDTMLKIYPGADGMKTGFTDASGFNLVTSAVRGGVRLIGVELGAANNGQRDIEMTALLNRGYAALDVPTGMRPVEAANRVGVASRIALISSAHAATIERAPPIRRVARETRIEREPRIVARARPAGPGDWSVQVGVFDRQPAARAMAIAARRMTEAGDPRVEPTRVRGRPAWRAQLASLTPPEAVDACAMLARHHTPCLVLRPEPRVVASR